VGEIFPALDYLSRQSLVTANQDGYQAQEHFREPLSEWAIPPKSDQAKILVTKLNKKQCSLISKLDGEMASQQLMDALGQSHKTHFKNKQLKPLIDLALVLEKYPNTPRHPDQAYYLTSLGKQVKALLLEQ
jgi:hypothetical protein